MKVICILPSVCFPGSNGIMVLCQIYRSLQVTLPGGVVFLHKKGRNATEDLYRKWFGSALISYLGEEQEEAVAELTSAPFILVRPDDLEGVDNPAHWDLARSLAAHQIINLLLAPPFAFAEKKSIFDYYGKRDCFLLINYAIMPAFARLEQSDLFIESRLDPLVEHFVNKQARSPSNPIAVYLGKGIGHEIPGFRDVCARTESTSPDSIVFIKRSWPPRKKELYSLLSRSQYLISFDPFSHIERVSTYLGTPVLKMSNYNIQELPGVSHIRKTIVDALDCLPSPSVVHYESARHHNTLLAKVEQNLSTIASVIESAACGRHEEVLSHAAVITFSRRCLYSFGSQLRRLLPQLGAIAMASHNEALQKETLFELLCYGGEESMLSPSALDYKRNADTYRSSTLYGGGADKSGLPYYQF